MLFSQTSLPQALLINKLRAKCPGSCFWHLSWNSYIVFYLFLPTLHLKPWSEDMLIFCNFLNNFFSTHIFITVLDRTKYNELWTVSNLTGRTSNSLEPRFVNQNWTLDLFETSPKIPNFEHIWSEMGWTRVQILETKIWTFSNPGLSSKTEQQTL